MEQKHHFIITRYCPMEQLFDGYMTFTDARKFMDENASNERRVGFKVFNDHTCKWEDFKNVAYHGGRKVYDKGDLYIIDPDYRNMWKPESQMWHLWFEKSDGSRLFCQSFATEEQANARREFLTADWREGKYIVEPSDIEL